jgi:predicted RNA polymerase sigma factor
MVEGPAAGLALRAPLEHDNRLRGGHRLDAVRAHLLERAGDRSAAAALYRAAAAKTTSLPERNYLLLKATPAE